eukprot:5446320-Lingulodinium_polyedra.AAC.1
MAAHQRQSGLGHAQRPPAPTNPGQTRQPMWWPRDPIAMVFAELERFTAAGTGQATQPTQSGGAAGAECATRVERHQG